MSVVVDRSQIRRLAGLELNELVHAGHMPAKLFDHSTVASVGTPVYDVNGELLFNRVPIRKGRTAIGYVDLAVNDVLGGPYLASSHGAAWDARALKDQAVRAARRLRRTLRFGRMRFVAYSYPKIAVQFLRRDEEVLMLELGTWMPVPAARRRRRGEPPANFERWSLIEELAPARKRANARRMRRRVARWNEVCPPRRRFEPRFIRVADYGRLIRSIDRIRRVFQRELHYGPRTDDHTPCYELRGQLTNVWCVAASVQMILDFYRYNYDQTRIARDLGLGTLSNPSGLPYGQDGQVVTVLDDLSNEALDATMNTGPTWAEFVSEIRANRPLVSFIPGHSRTVAGYTYGLSVLGGMFRGLLVYDPWPPSPSVPPVPTTGGVITRWENFDTHTYRRTFTAVLQLV